MNTDLDTARAEAVDWFWREVEFWIDEGGREDDEIGREVKSVLGVSLDMPNLYGRSVLSIQQAAAYIAGRRAA